MPMPRAAPRSRLLELKSDWFQRLVPTVSSAIRAFMLFFARASSAMDAVPDLDRSLYAFCRPVISFWMLPSERMPRVLRAALALPCICTDDCSFWYCAEVLLAASPAAFSSLADSASLLFWVCKALLSRSTSWDALAYALAEESPPLCCISWRSSFARCLAVVNSWFSFFH